MQMRERITTKLGWTLALGCVLLTGVEASLRGPLRFMKALDFNDFISPYVQTRLWVEGSDPYSPNNLVKLWPADVKRPDFLVKDLDQGSLIIRTGIPTAYPPTTFPILAPLVILPWHIAQPLWMALCLTAYAMTVFSLALVIKLDNREKIFYVFIAAALALAPFHT